jgi:glutamine cyclotransferase
VDIGANPARILKSIPVRDGQGMVSNINELEWVNGLIFANIWQTSVICVIDPATGSVVGKLDFLPIYIKEARMNPQIDVLNGIAYNKTRQTLLVTGKYWSHFYEIRLKAPLPKPSL